MFERVKGWVKLGRWTGVQDGVQSVQVRVAWAAKEVGGERGGAETSQWIRSQRDEEMLHWKRKNKNRYNSLEHEEH